MDFTSSEKPLFVSPNTQLEPPQKTFFYERPNGTIIHVGEAEAWEIECNRSKNFFKQLGVSDGTTFQKAVIEAQELLATKGLGFAQERIRKGEQEELEAARGHFERPKNANVSGPAAQEAMRMGIR